MSRMICVMGESGSGKTTSMRTLNPDSTYYIDCDKKGLAWKGWRNQYNSEKKNFFSGRDLPKISQILLGVSEKRTDISTIVIDTLNTCMVDKEIKAMNDKDGFGKWIDLTQYVWNICETAATLRDDITVIVAMHSETIRDDLGYTFTRIKTNGRKLEKSCWNLFLALFYLPSGPKTDVMCLKLRQKTALPKALWAHLKHSKLTTIWAKF